MIAKRIDKELTEALKAKNADKVSCLRMLKSDMKNLAIQKKEELKEADIIKVIQKQVKQHKDSIEQFEKGDRNDLAEKEKRELVMLEAFLPKQMPKAELEKLIKGVIAETGPSGKKEMGRVIKEVMAKTKGTADGKTVSQLVSGLLK